MDRLIEHFLQHHDHFLYALAGVALVLELGVLGINGPLLFFSVASILTGVLISVGLLNGWELEVLTLGILTSLTALVLWKPLKKFQNATIPLDTSSDMIGRVLPVTLEVTRDQGRLAYSGIEWQARLHNSANESIPIAARATVVTVDGSLLMVKKSIE